MGWGEGADLGLWGGGGGGDAETILRTGGCGDGRESLKGWTQLDGT